MADDAAADTGADLDDEEVLELAALAPEHAERHQVHVIVDEDGRIEDLAQVVADGIAVPTWHERRIHELADSEIDRAGYADADGQNRVAGDTVLSEHRGEKRA